VEKVLTRLRRANVGYCATKGQTRPEIGLIVWSLANFPNTGDRARLQQTYGLTDKVTIALAVAGSPAEAMGLEQGAAITHVNGTPVFSGKGATERYIAVSNAEARKGPVTLRLDSGTEITVPPETLCAYPLLLVRSPEVNAVADGQVIAITTTLVDQTRTDDELALILAHELAHNVLGHLDAPASGKPAGIIDALARTTVSAAMAAGLVPAHSTTREKEADRAGLYFMARAGYDPEAAEAFWARLNATTRPAAMLRTHPSGPERQKALRTALMEIKTLQKAGRPVDFPITPRQ
jgi:hypothetical protein